MRITVQIFVILILTTLSACEIREASYNTNTIEKNDFIQLTRWNILGNIICKDTTTNQYLDKNHFASFGQFESEFCKNPFDFKIRIPRENQLLGAFSRSYYSSDESIIDLSAHFHERALNQSDVIGSALFYYCKVHTPKVETLFLTTRSSNGIKVLLNGDSIYRSYEPKGFEATFSEFIPIKLKKGENILVIKRVNHSKEWLLEARLCKRNAAAEELKKKCTQFLLKNPIAQDSIHLLSDYAKDMDTTLLYSISDLDGKQLQSEKSSNIKENAISIRTLKNNHAYLFYFNLAGKHFSHAFFVGNPEKGVDYLKRISKHYYGSRPDTSDIGNYLFRLEFLLRHPSREDDWWWKYKVASLLTEACNILNNYSKNLSAYRQTFGIQYKSYKSSLDGNMQRYLLIQPEIAQGNARPLVVVLRPHIENNYPFLCSPQLSRYWSLTYAKYLADKFGFFIMMPEGRMYLREPLIPMANAEIDEAIEDVKKNNNINPCKIFLLGNCTAGNRCLVYAGHHTEQFAAIGLYAPLYELPSTSKWEKDNQPNHLLGDLHDIPILVHHDPIDRHSPPSFFQSLIRDAKKNRISVQMSSKLNSGLHYNVLLVGEEAFRFFEDKSRLNNRTTSKYPSKQDMPDNKGVIADLFSKPFLFVYDKRNKSTRAVVDSLSVEYRTNLHCKIPIKDIRELTDLDFNKNLFVIGHDFPDGRIRDILRTLSLEVTAKWISINGANHDGQQLIFQGLFANPQQPKQKIVVYSSNYPKGFRHCFNTPWKTGFFTFTVLSCKNSEPFH